MDIDALHSTLLSIALLSDKLRGAREEFRPSGKVEPSFDKFLSGMEHDLALAKATLATELGFSICPHCWPPELTATGFDVSAICPACGKAFLDQAA